MTEIARTLNRALARTIRIQAVRADRRPVTLSKSWFATLVHFNGLVQEIAGVDGDVVECGVAGGASLAMLTSLITVHGQSRRMWGFDSWAGLPAPCAADLSDSSVAVSGMFSDTSTRRVREELLAYGLTHAEVTRTVRLVPGLFTETLPQYQGRIALLHVDVDLYQSYLDCLTNLWRRVVVGGVVAFDEYGEPETWPGARRAVDEFLSRNAHEVSDLRQDQASGKWWVVKVQA